MAALRGRSLDLRLGFAESVEEVVGVDMDTGACACVCVCVCVFRSTGRLFCASLSGKLILASSCISGCAGGAGFGPAMLVSGMPLFRGGCWKTPGKLCGWNDG